MRYIAAVYGRRDVIFTTGATVEQSGTASRVTGPVRIPDPIPYVDGKLTPRARRAIVERVQADSTATMLSMCCVFTPDDAVYVKPEGGAFRSRTPPCGGVRFDDVQVVGKPPRVR